MYLIPDIKTLRYEQRERQLEASRRRMVRDARSRTSIRQRWRLRLSLRRRARRRLALGLPAFGR